LGPNLFVYTPYVAVHDVIALRLPWLMRLNRRLLSGQLNQMLATLDFGAPQRMIWIYHPFQMGYMGLVGEIVTVYENYDEISEGKSISPREKTWIQQLEQRLLRQVDVVFATAVKLVEAKKVYNSNIHFMPEAVDFALFSKSADPGTPVAEAMAGLPRPIVGFMGVTNERCDFNMLTYIAKMRPSWTFAFTGPVSRNDLRDVPAFAEFENLPNVKFLGWLPREEMPSYGKAFEVGIIPYRTDYALNEFVHPLKLYEFTAMGKPVVSMDIPGIHRYRDIIKVAHTPEEFLHCIEQSLAEDGPDKIAIRLKRAREDSWDKRVEQEMMIIQETLTRKLQYRSSHDV
jgi:hypothetical protein